MRVFGFQIVVAIALATLCSCAMVDYTGESTNKPIRETGITATAEILEIWDTGVRVNDSPVVGLRLLVIRADGSAYESETKNIISIVHLCQFRPGEIVAVKVDVEDETLVALDVIENR